jgi:hypothetical protein
MSIPDDVIEKIYSQLEKEYVWDSKQNITAGIRAGIEYELQRASEGEAVGTVRQITDDGVYFAYTDKVYELKIGDKIYSTPQLAKPEVREALIKEAVNRFLCWKLPEHFRPDAGISFSPEYNKEYMAKQGKPPMRHEPVGTNLFGADQAKAMFEHCIPTLIEPKYEAVRDALDKSRKALESFNAWHCNSEAADAYGDSSLFEYYCDAINEIGLAVRALKGGT